MAISRNTNALLLTITQFWLHLSLSSALFSPIDNHLIDCGSGSAPAILDDRRAFVSDSKPTVSARLLSPGPKIAVSDPNPNPNSSPLYRTARVFTKPSAYELRIQSKGTHLIRLHFYPFATESYNLSSSQFHVTAAGFVLLNDITFESATVSPQFKEYFVNLDSHKLVLAFVPAGPSSFAFVNAIEVVSAPEDLIGDAARLVNFDKVENFNGISKQALQTLYRINVGGPKVTPFNDTFWRDWVPDSVFLMSNSPSKVVNFSGRIKYKKVKGWATREVAPDNVYSSARTSSSNMTWAFAVDPGYKYFIRLHFCDIASLALNELYLDVYINGYSAYGDFDISDATYQLLASPYYLDFVANADSGLLSVGIGPSKFSDPLKVGALLNGLEIMKINNTVGSLDGESSVVFVLENPRVGSLGAVVRTLVCGFAFVSLWVVVFMLALRWRAERRDPVAWMQLPVDVSDGELVKESPLVPDKFVGFTVYQSVVKFLLERENITKELSGLPKVVEDRQGSR